jgi:hypothetical protein
VKYKKVGLNRCCVRKLGLIGISRYVCMWVGGGFNRC